MIPPTGPQAATFVRPRWTVGHYYAAADVVRGTLALTLDRLFLVPFDVPLGAKIDRLGIEVSTAGAAGAVARLGVYRCTADGRPGSLLIDAGTVDAATIGAKEVTLASPLSLPDGRVFLAMAPQVAAATFRTQATSHDRRVGAASLATATAGNGQNAYYYTNSVTGAFPAVDITASTATATHGPVVVARAA